MVELGLEKPEGRRAITGYYIDLGSLEAHVMQIRCLRFRLTPESSGSWCISCKTTSVALELLGLEHPNCSRREGASEAYWHSVSVISELMRLRNVLRNRQRLRDFYDTSCGEPSFCAFVNVALTSDQVTSLAPCSEYLGIIWH